MHSASTPRSQWICCQIGAREHYAVARALHRHDALRLLITDAWVRPSNPLATLSPRLRARYHAELGDADVHGSAFRNVAFELRARHSKLRMWALMMARNRWFQRVALSRLSRIDASTSTPVLMSYSYAAGELFAYARHKGWRTVLCQIDPGPREEEIVSKLHEGGEGQGSSWERAPKTYWSDWRNECALADRIVVNSSWSRDALIGEGIPSKKIRIVPLAYERSSGALGFQRRYPTSFDSARPLRVLFLGQINLRKGVAPILDAIRLLRDQPVEFTFVGPTQISIPDDLSNGSRVRWLGTAPRQSTDAFYRDADVFLFPTFSDGFGLTQLEAQAWKLPVIATRFCGDVVQNGRNGWVLSEITPMSIVTLLRELLGDPSRLQAVSEQSGLDEKFDLTSIGRQWLEVID